MRNGEVLVFEFIPVDGFASCSVSPGEITALDHEVFDDSMESRPKVILLSSTRLDALTLRKFQLHDP